MGAEPSTPIRPNRRTVIRAAGLTGSAGLLAGAGTGPQYNEQQTQLSAHQRAVVLRVARAGANVPVRFPSFGERGSPESRATEARLVDAIARLTPVRLSRVAIGTDALLERGIARSGRARLLAVIGRLAGDPTQLAAMEAVAAVAIATVSTSFDPNSDHPAGLWVGGLRHLGERGRHPLPVAHLEVRR